MRWLLTGKLTPAVADALRRHGHHAQTIPDAGLPVAAPVDEVFAAAHRLQLDVMTDEAAFATAPFSDTPTVFARTLVYLNLEGGDVEQDDAVDRLFQRYSRLSPGRLYTVTASRVKVRQLPGRAR